MRGRTLTAVLVVGIDRTGKTPLIRLMQRVDPQIVYRRLVDTPQVEYSLSAAKYEIGVWKRNRRLLVYDRFPYPDEFVYGSQLSRMGFPEWEAAIARCGTPVVAVYVEPHNLSAFRTRAAQDPDAHFDMTDMDIVLEHVGRYKTWLTQTAIPVLRMSCDKEFGISDAKQVLDWVRKW
jgi:hypothetical protein